MKFWRRIHSRKEDNEQNHKIIIPEVLLLMLHHLKFVICYKKSVSELMKIRTLQQLTTNFY